MKNDKRRFFRKAADIQAHFTIPGGSRQESTVINFSAGGFCFYAKQELPVGAIVLLTAQLEGNESVSLRVTTAWTKKIADTGDYVIGVRIADATGEDLVKFLEYYARELSQFLHDLKDINKDG